MNYEKITAKKHELDKYRPLPKELVRNLEDWFRVELTYTSNAIEGNTLTRAETALVVEKGLTVTGKTLRECLEAVNHAKAFDWIKNFVKQKNRLIKEKDVLQIHEFILQGIDDINSGRYRNVAVRISGSMVVLPNPRKVPDLMTNLIKWLNTAKDLHPVNLAAEAHYRLVTIHPFVDGNGRTARLLMNLILMSYGYPPAIIRKQDRLDYIKSLEEAQLGGSKDAYMKIIMQAVERSLDIYLEAVTEGEPTKPVKLFKIGQLAKQTGESISAIRFWTKEGLLEVAETTAAGYQLYDATMIERIKKIKELKNKRYTILEIKRVIKQ